MQHSSHKQMRAQYEMQNMSLQLMPWKTRKPLSRTRVHALMQDKMLVAWRHKALVEGTAVSTLMRFLSTQKAS